MTGARVGVFRVLGSNTDAGTFDKINVTAISYSAPPDLTRCALMFVPAGLTGAVGGALGFVDGVIPKSSGSGGTTLQPSSLTESTAGKLSVNLVSTAAASAPAAIRISNLPVVAATAGVGVGLEFETKNGSSAPFLAGEIRAEARSVVGSSEKSDLVFRTMRAGVLTEQMRLRDSGNLELGSSAILALKTSGGQTLTGGFTATAFNIPSVAGTTVTPSGANGQLQYLSNNGAFQINPPSADTALDILVTNVVGSGAITFSPAFTIGTSVGDALPTAVGKSAIVSIQRINGVSTYSIRSLSTSS